MTPTTRGGLLLVAAVAIAVAAFSTSWWDGHNEDRSLRGTVRLGLLEVESCFVNVAGGDFLGMYDDGAERCSSQSLASEDELPRRVRLMIWAGRLAFGAQLVAMLLASALGIMQLGPRHGGRRLAMVTLGVTGAAMVATIAFLLLWPKVPLMGTPVALAWASLVGPLGLMLVIAGAVAALGSVPVFSIEPEGSRWANAPASAVAAAVDAVPRASDGRPTPPCPGCTAAMAWSQRYQRHFCASCKLYL